ncbi:putative transcriptional regulator, AraC family [Leadbettera azotonutricia ZAS-9]|uniref:Putative transcriptional regulator, AraC family n=1 Tax=Leadbettera azotonutricia (strain ATCC BAA-888 / DSM 13862 / ZAS-9) TaxID=545695 RepID=F5Y956_LEAAZ|nr:putative transcriptional regulator, AraC family [Leadbettera azotonutricia ZAS-9]
MKVNERIQSTMYRHSHEFFEFVYVEEGFCLHFSGSGVELLMGGDLLAMSPGMEHYYWCKKNITIVNIMFLPEIFSGLMKDIKSLPGMEDFFEGKLQNPLLSHLSFDDREEMRRIINALRKEEEQKIVGWELRSKALLTNVIIILSRVVNTRFSKQGNKNPYLGYTLKTVERIEENYSEALTVRDLAGSLGIGPDHLTRQFHQIMGITPTEYLRRRRFAKALELLRKQQPVSEVYAASGFRSINYFSREFKNLFKMTPSEFKRQAKLNK